MNINKIKYFIFAAILFATSCEKTVIFDVDTQENKIVLKCLFGPDADAAATVSLSKDPLAVHEEIQYLDNATLSLYKNDNYLADFTYMGEKYILDAATIDAHPGDHFKLEASAPGRESVSAETTIPPVVELTSVEIIDTTYESIYYSTIDSLGNIIVVDSLLPYYIFEITFNDPSGTDYYSLEITYEDALSSTYTCFTTGDPAFVLEGTFGDTEEEVTLCSEVDFSDLTFEGETKSIQLSLLQIQTEFITDPKFVFKLRHLSEDYYKYLSSSSLQLSSQDDPFAEPVIVFSNIENGFGIFAGYSLSEVEFGL